MSAVARRPARATALLGLLEGMGEPARVALGLALVGLVGVVDYLTGYEVAFSLFYVLPISLVAWLCRQRFGLLAAFASALAWFGADAASGNPYSHPLIPLWNTLIRLSFFVIITLLLSALKRAVEAETHAARTDHLTGAVNSRLFAHLAQLEIERCRRYGRPFTLAYVDLDNFKAVNDRLGHSTGDEVLRTVVAAACDRLRRTDTIARLGGDEFALLLPETGLAESRVVLPKLRDGVLGELRRRNWPVTLSIGALTCAAPPASTDELVRLADGLMYSVKHGGKDEIAYAAFPDRSADPAGGAPGSTAF